MSPTPYYQDDAVTIYHGDCIEVMDALGPDVADIVVTSPPYNMGVTPGGNGRGVYGHTTQHARRFTLDGYDGASDARPPDEYDAWLREVLVRCAHATTGAVWFNHRPRVRNGRAWVPLDMDFAFLAEPTGDRFGPRQVAIWDRKQSTGTNAGLLSIRSEWVMLFAWDGFKMDRKVVAFGDVWSFGVPANKHGHPDPFPEELPERCIALSRPSVVLDPFVGSGTSLVAAKRAGVKAIGIDQSARFCAIAAERCGGPIVAGEGTLFAAAGRQVDEQ